MTILLSFATWILIYLFFLFESECLRFFYLPFVPCLHYYVSSSFIIRESAILDQSIVQHVCFDLFQHTTKIDGELVYVFDLLVGIDNHRKQYYNQIEKMVL